MVIAKVHTWHSDHIRPISAQIRQDDEHQGLMSLSLNNQSYP